MTPRHALSLAPLLALAGCLLCCKAEGVPRSLADWDARSETSPGRQATGAPTISKPNGQLDLGNHQPGQTVTVIIALSSIVPGGIIGHAGLAVEDQYWDFGPQRSTRLQPIKSIRSEAGPWWDDPDQQWTTDRCLSEVLADIPDKVHPLGSLVAVIQVQVTDEQAQAITDFWQDTYTRMENGQDTYRLSARQCASMVGWSLQVGLQNNEGGDRLPRDLHLMSPTRLYETLSASLTHTAGPDQGKPADLSLWQLDQQGLSPWQRPSLCDRLALPELPRIRLAFERFKHLPSGLIE